VPVGVSARRTAARGLGFHVVEDDVVALLGSGEVGPRVVNDVVGPERPDQVDVAGAAHTRHLGAKRLGDLDGEGAHAARRARDQHRLARSNVRDLAQCLQRRHGRRGHRCRVHDRQVGRHGHEVVRRDAGVLRERSSGAPAEHLVAGAESGDILAERCQHAGEVPARDAVARPAEPERQAHHVRLTGHDEVVAGMYRGRAHLDEHIASTGQRYPDLGRLEQDRGSDQDPLGD
jgi:hypothetical protein